MMKRSLTIFLYTLCILPHISKAADNAVDSYLRGGSKRTLQKSYLRGSSMKRTHKAAPTDSITVLKLVDSLTNEEVMDLFNDTEVVLSALGYTDPTFNIQAVTSTTAGDIKSVKFGYGSDGSFKLENKAPYALCGDSSGIFNTCSILTPGTHTVTATPYEAFNAGGAAGDTLWVNFTIIEEDPTEIPHELAHIAVPASTTSTKLWPAMAPISITMPPPTAPTRVRGTAALEIV